MTLIYCFRLMKDVEIVVVLSSGLSDPEEMRWMVLILRGEAEKARAVLLFGNGPNRVRRAGIFHRRFPIVSGVCFVRTRGAFVPVAWYDAAISNCPSSLAISL